MSITTLDPPPAPGAVSAPEMPWISRADEDELVERARAAPEAFGELYDRHLQRIHSFVAGRVQDPAVAEDITADVFLRALRGIGRYRPCGRPFSAWLYRIATNAVTDHYRERRRRCDPLESQLNLPSPECALDQRVADRLDVERVWATIDTLPEHQRTALTLRLRDDLALAQIGARMGKSEGAVKLLLHRGVHGVRRRLALPEEIAAA